MFFQQALINMGIFDRKSITKTIKTTEGFYFGKSESEGESSYKKSSNTLFDDYLDILPKIGDGCFIITGRKGSGKSAHLQSSVFKLSKDLIDSIHEEGIVAYTS